MSAESVRLAALERQVADLTARLEERREEPPPTPAYGRRDLLLRGGAVLATSGGGLLETRGTVAFEARVVQDGQP
ncbi:MAG: hypothetical protein JWO60_2960, partial [Frankiales bacterium]|nr:hypothetical protein [Frankiales bacterium]